MNKPAHVDAELYAAFERAWAESPSVSISEEAAYRWFLEGWHAAARQHDEAKG